jgi:hypothetical protein
MSTRPVPSFPLFVSFFDLLPNEGRLKISDPTLMFCRVKSVYGIILTLTLAEITSG